jgi:hypothetical protein
MIPDAGPLPLPQLLLLLLLLLPLLFAAVDVVGTGAAHRSRCRPEC